MINCKIKETQLQIRSYINNMQFNIMLTDRHDVVLEFSWLKDINLKINFWKHIINFSTEKLVHMSKEMSESALKIYAILVNKLKKKIWENLEQVKIL